MEDIASSIVWPFRESNERTIKKLSMVIECPIPSGTFETLHQSLLSVLMRPSLEKPRGGDDDTMLAVSLYRDGGKRGELEMILIRNGRHAVMGFNRDENSAWPRGMPDTYTTADFEMICREWEVRKALRLHPWMTRFSDRAKRARIKAVDWIWLQQVPKYRFVFIPLSQALPHPDTKPDALGFLIRRGGDLPVEIITDTGVETWMLAEERQDSTPDYTGHSLVVLDEFGEWSYPRIARDTSQVKWLLNTHDQQLLRQTIAEAHGV
jgi:hypothetical protein